MRWLVVALGFLAACRPEIVLYKTVPPCPGHAICATAVVGPEGTP